MKTIGKWSWALAFGLPFVVGGLLFWRGVVRLHYEGHAVLTYSGKGKPVAMDPKIFKPHRGAKIVFQNVAGQPRQLALRAEGDQPDAIVQSLQEVGRILGEQSVTKQKAGLKKIRDENQSQIKALSATVQQLTQSRQLLLAGPKKNTPRAQTVSRIEELKSRRSLLIEHYPTHTDIQLLAKQIQDLSNQRGRPAAPVMEKVTDVDRKINEAHIRRAYFSKRLAAVDKIEKAIKPSWTISQPIQTPRYPNRVDGWPIGAGAVGGCFALGVGLCILRAKLAKGPANGLWKPAAAGAPTGQPSVPVQLEVVSPETTLVPVEEAELPSDPLTQTAAQLYTKWVEVAQVLYTPSIHPPQGILDSVSPLLEETTAFLPTGHDVLARYLARSVTPGDLAAHVARTVLMTLTGAEEAGVLPEHRTAMALAALFHDLAVVPRPEPQQDNVGSEIGRLSAAVLRRIPGLDPAVLTMVEEILIGMDEFKLETWQNVANGSNLEPLSKVLREIDRFEKVMQKQKSRLDRRVANS